jgi:hypothetical protein
MAASVNYLHECMILWLVGEKWDFFIKKKAHIIMIWAFGFLTCHMEVKDMGHLLDSYKWLHDYHASKPKTVVFLIILK